MDKGKSKYIIITPYFKESEKLLRRCIDSVNEQSVPCNHLLVADGFPQDWIDDEDVRHLKLDGAHGDLGNTARGVGALLAIAEEYEGIGLLDADNWLESDHAELCLEAANKYAGGIGNCDFVIASRFIRRADETIMPIAEEPGHVDTSCFFFLPGSYAFLPHWASMPKVTSAIGDRVFNALIKAKSLTSARTRRRSVNYLSLYRSHYEALGEVPPADAKSQAIFAPIELLKDIKSSREVDIVNRLIGFEFLKTEGKS